MPLFNACNATGTVGPSTPAASVSNPNLLPEVRHIGVRFVRANGSLSKRRLRWSSLPPVHLPFMVSIYIYKWGQRLVSLA